MTKYGIRTNSDIVPLTSETVNIGNASLNFNNVRAKNLIANNGTLQVHAVGSTGQVQLKANNLTGYQVFESGRTASVNGGGTDDGESQLRVVGLLKSTTINISNVPAISAGGFSILTRNTSNGSVEIISKKTIDKLTTYTVSTLPTGEQGDTAMVTDATAPTYLGALTGGGSVKCPVFYNGTAWVSA